MASTSFIALGPSSPIADIAGSGLGFFGPGGFASSVQVGAWADTVFITNSAGTIQGASVNSVKYLNSASGICQGAPNGTGLLYIPNYEVSLNLRLTNPTPVHTQNGYVTVYDGVNTANPGSGLVAALAEMRHPGLLLTQLGSGSPNWVLAAGTGTVLNLSNSPGTSGLGGGLADTQHDYFLAISESPSSVGSKTQQSLFWYQEFF